MTCPLCQIVKKEIKALPLYEDEQIMAVMHPFPASLGHVIVFPKNHVQILTMVDDPILIKMHEVVQKISSSVFDALGSQGTNILIQNGELAGQTLAHFVINVLPRSVNDTLNFEWQPKQTPQEELDAILKSYAETQQKLIAAQSVVTPKEGDTNYMLKQLKRIP